MLTNAMLQKLKDDGKICLKKIIGAVLIACTNDKEGYTEIVEYIEFDNSVSDPTNYPVDKGREIIGVIPVYDIYSIYAINADKLIFLGYNSNDELVIDTTDWNHLYDTSVLEGE